MSKIKKEPQQNETNESEVKFRYICEGCTKNALESTNEMVGIEIVCKECGKTQITKGSNFIAL